MLTTLLAAATLAAPAVPAGSEIQWEFGSYTNTLGKATTAKQPMLVYIWANTEQCTKLYGGPLQDEKVAAAFEGFVCLSANAGEPAGKKLVERFAVETVPTMIFVDETGQPVDTIVGFIPADALVYEVERIREGTDTIPDFRKRLTASTVDLDERVMLLSNLSQKLRYVGAMEESHQAWDQLLAADPECQTEIGTQAHLKMVMKGLYEGREEGDESPLDLKPLYKFAKKIKSPVGQFAAWGEIAQVEHYNGNVGRCVDAIGTAWKLCPEERTAEWGAEAAWKLLEMGHPDENGKATLKTKERKALNELGLAMATRAAEMAEASYAEECADGGAKMAEKHKKKYGECEGCDDGSCMSMYGKSLAKSLALRGMWQFRAGDKKSAVATMTRVVELDPENEEWAQYAQKFNAG